MTWNRSFVVTALALTVSFLAPSRGECCSCVGYDYAGPSVEPRWHGVDDVPANALALGNTTWSVAVVRDDALSEASGVNVSRVTGLNAGDELGWGCATGECESRITVGDADEVAPGAASITALFIELPAIPEEGNAGCEFDSMTLRMDAADDRTPSDLLRPAVYIGVDEADVAARTEPNVLLASERTFRGAAEITLGWSGDHRRDGLRLRQEGRFCFAIAAVDLAGNVGPRSDTVCLNSTDLDDPFVMAAEYDPACSGLFCSMSPGAGSQGPASVFCLLGGVLIYRRSRQAR